MGTTPERYNLSDIADEHDLIDWIRRRSRSSRHVALGIGDDCAAIRVPTGNLLVVTTDILAAGVHYSPEEVSPRQVGRKAAARALSDIAAMAAEPLALLAALSTPPDISSAYLKELFLGMRHMAWKLGTPIVGGDVSAGDTPLILTMTALGSAPEDSLALRSGARPGDMVLVTGELGGSILGRHLTFIPRIAEAKWIAKHAHIHAMIDISDGLSTDVCHIADESGVALELWAEAIPVSRAARRLAEHTGREPLDHALDDGEDYELLFTTPARDAARLLDRRDRPVKLTCIGEVFKGSGVWLKMRDGKRHRVRPGGWTHRF